MYDCLADTSYYDTRKLSVHQPLAVTLSPRLTHDAACRLVCQRQKQILTTSTQMHFMDGSIELELNRLTLLTTVYTGNEDATSKLN